MNDMYTRTIGLIGEEGFSKLQNSTVLVVGLGGVGGTALEALARSGVGNFIIVDMDEVTASNLNRQILYSSENIGNSKVFSAKSRLFSLDKDIKVTALDMKVSAETISKLNELKIDFIVDAIDDVNGKLALAKFALENSIPFIASLGMANRLDPSQVMVTRLDKTTDDPLAKKFRYEVKKMGLETNKIMVVVSKEKPIKDSTNLHSMMMVPSSAGLNIANYVINYLIK